MHYLPAPRLRRHHDCYAQVENKPAQQLWPMQHRQFLDGGRAQMKGDGGFEELSSSCRVVNGRDKDTVLQVAYSRGLEALS
ncbi:hypothetical protein P0078_12740 [Microbulbifer sp. VAAF005]|nr:hypothetical protein [Microbulbifer sp. VAAF005]WHI49171.1 hypothetical protein P0078_12740 [Microbulbifer sp. VAAF005]